ncbi:MAG: hypothetical protein ABW217_15380 [Polyangiaceae bacterium]
MNASRSGAGRATRIAAALVACCIALLGLSPNAHAQSDSEWFQDGGD